MKAMVYSDVNSARFISCAVRTTEDGKTQMAALTGTKQYWENKVNPRRLLLQGIIETLKVANEEETIDFLTEDDYARRVVYNFRNWKNDGWMVKGLPDGFGGYGAPVPCRNIDLLKQIDKLCDAKHIKMTCAKAEVTAKVKAMIEVPSTEVEPAKAPAEAPVGETVVETVAEPVVEKPKAKRKTKTKVKVEAAAEDIPVEDMLPF